MIRTRGISMDTNFSCSSQLLYFGQAGRLGLGETHWNSIATWFWGTSINGPCQNVKCWYGVILSIHWSFDLTSTAELFVVLPCFTFLSCMNIGTTVYNRSVRKKILPIYCFRPWKLLQGQDAPSTKQLIWMTGGYGTRIQYTCTMSFPLMRTAMKHMNNFQIDFVKNWKFHVVLT